MKIPLVYMIQNTQGHIKVGYSGVLNKRFDQVAPASPYPCELVATYYHPQARKIEPILHKILADVRLHGEWVNCSLGRIFDAIPMANAVLRHRTNQSEEVKPRANPPKYIFNTDSLPYNVKVEQLIDMVGGRGKLLKTCDLSQTALSNWKTQGIPEKHLYRLLQIGLRDNLDMPEWLTDPDYQEPFT